MICPVCNRDIPVNKSGEMARHKRSKSSRVLCLFGGALGSEPAKKKKPKRRIVRTCPTHGTKLTGNQTSYGWRWHCPEEGCTVVAWGGSTSTPADAATRAARIRAHDAFDPLWAYAGWKRSTLYRELSLAMGIEQKDCHIGMFNAEQCEQVIEFCRTFRLTPSLTAGRLER